MKQNIKIKELKTFLYKNDQKIYKTFLFTLFVVLSIPILGSMIFYFNKNLNLLLISLLYLVILIPLGICFYGKDKLIKYVSIYSLIIMSLYVILYISILLIYGPNYMRELHYTQGSFHDFARWSRSFWEAFNSKYTISFIFLLSALGIVFIIIPEKKFLKKNINKCSKIIIYLSVFVVTFLPYFVYLLFGNKFLY
ncbi:MAG: hypothetical protein LBU87_02070 [Lactobacillales bacterium]|nr:hypothetical protein [Lactobacillales bacterium]